MTFTRRKFFAFSGSVAALSLFSQAEAMPVEPPTKYDGDFDIVIVGGGGAGLSAACAASELGASVLVKTFSWRILSYYRRNVCRRRNEITKIQKY